jgi:asparagine synthase (glutamine-hydrolysing)
MCGISGYIAKSGTIESILLKKMTSAVAHRGPDDEGIFIDDRIGLGHRRLAIIDLTEAGHQPMHYKNYVIVFNGEVYNYLELKKELIKIGHNFKTRTDTEVILHSYEEWGDKCISLFNGMWAFAIYDRSERKLFCSRDRFGIKPLYYVSTPDVFVFGSEIRQLLPFLTKVSANSEVVQEFLLAGISDPEEETFFEGVYKLHGGSNILYDLESHSFTIKPYYRLCVQPHFESLNVDESIQMYGEILSSAVMLRLRADVAVGTCLSGGLDSSSIATMAAIPYQKERREPFQAITAVSELHSNDESKYAKQVVEHSGMKWLKIKPTYDDFKNTLDDVVRAQEEPFGSPSICMQYFVMKTARENKIPVLLDGQGGDETLLGYERYYASHFLNIMRSRGIVFAAKSLRDSWRNNDKMSPMNSIMYLIYFSFARLRYINYCYRSRYLKKYPSQPKTMKMSAKAIWNIKALQKLEINITNLPQLLRFEDKNSMWHSIETRLPFLDYRAVEAALSLTDEAKINHGWTKYALRCFMEGRMPPSIIWRRNKYGFEAPESLWLTKHASVMNNAISASKLLSKICKRNVLNKIYSKLDDRTKWRLYSVALWERIYGVEC